LDFWQGNKLKDAGHYLIRGTNKKVYHKIFKAPEEINEAAVALLLREAVEVNRSFQLQQFLPLKCAVKNFSRQFITVPYESF
jgi:hypothetical protein